MKITTITTIKILLLPIFAVASLCMIGCASMFPGTGAKRSTSVVEFLYPNKRPHVQPTIPTLSLPMRVGVVFVPSQTDKTNSQMPEATRNALMRTVSDQFKKLPYVQGIELIPTHYLRPGGSFENLDQLRSLLGIDVIVLLAYDQQQNTTDTWLTLSYWTIVGAYTMPAQKNSTATLMDATVYDIASRKLLFRAAGTDMTNNRSSMVGMTNQLTMDSGESYKNAAANLGANLQAELDSFKVRIKQTPSEVRVVAKPGYNLAAGALGGWEAAAMVVFAGAVLMVGFLRRRGRMVSLIMMFVCVASCSTGCVSAGLLSLGTTSNKVFGDKVFGNDTPHSRDHVERYLGAPVLVKQLSVLPTSEEFSDLSHQLRNGDWNYDRRKCAAHVYHGNLVDAQKRSQGRESQNGLLQTTTPFLYARYNYEGRLISRDLIGEYFVWGVLTLGIREFVQIPQALWILATDHKRLNYVSVWYDDGGRVVAYAWAWRDFSVPSPAGAQEQKQVDSQELKTFWNLQ